MRIIITAPSDTPNLVLRDLIYTRLNKLPKDIAKPLNEGLLDEFEVAVTNDISFKYVISDKVSDSNFESLVHSVNYKLIHLLEDPDTDTIAAGRGTDRVMLIFMYPPETQELSIVKVYVY